jgi:protein-S-isoprenylcysteine O-methyltransferase Ste14
MTVSDKLISQGNLLFRWRSFIPLLLLMPGVMAMADSATFEARYGDFLSETWVVIGVVISLLGLAIRWITVGFVPGSTSGRNTKEQRADFLNTDGMYSIVKNPLYLGNFLAILGVLVSLKVSWMVLVGSLAYWIYIERVIAAEEKFLIEKYGEKYLAWSKKTPIFVPNFSLWRKPSMAFSYKTVLKREYNGLFGLACAFFFTEMIVDVGFEHEAFSEWLLDDWPWGAGFVMGAMTFITLRTMKKHTNILRVEGR